MLFFFQNISLEIIESIAKTTIELVKCEGQGFVGSVFLYIHANERPLFRTKFV